MQAEQKWEPLLRQPDVKLVQHVRATLVKRNKPLPADLAVKRTRADELRKFPILLSTPA